MTRHMRSIGRIFRCIALIGVGAMSAALSHAADSTLLIQVEAEGKFRVWHVEGETNLNERELELLEASAAPDGGNTVETIHGPARAFETTGGIVIALPDAKQDRKLLLDRQPCSSLKAWHSEGETWLTDDQLADLVVTAAPDGGPTVAIGNYRAKAFVTKLGVMATIWKPVARRRND